MATTFMNEIRIKEITKDRGLICNDLLRSLPMWFGIESAIQKYCLDVDTMTTLAAFTENNRPVGFLSLNPHSEWTSEIHVMAIHPDYHRQGIGKELEKNCFMLQKNYCELLNLNSSLLKQFPLLAQTKLTTLQENSTLLWASEQ